MKKRTVSILLSLLLMLSLVVSVNAAEAIDTDGPATVTFTHVDQKDDSKKPIQGAEFKLWQVGVFETSGKVVLDPDMEQFAESVTGLKNINSVTKDENGATWKAIAETLPGKLTGAKIEPDYVSPKTGEDGKTSVEITSMGIYLVTVSTVSQDGYYKYADPFMISVPSLDHEANAWDYTVDVLTKTDRRDIPSDPTYGLYVLKQWEMGEGDAQDEEPEKQPVKLVVYDEKGKVVKTIELGKNGRWSKTSYLDTDSEYTFEEIEVPGFSTSMDVSFDGDKYTVIITNTWNGLEEPEIPEEPENPAEPPAPPVEPEQPELPATGALWWPVPLMAVLGIACFLMGWMRRRNYEN